MFFRTIVNVYIVNSKDYQPFSPKGYEDWLRHKADNEVNLRPTVILKGGKEVTGTKSQDIKVSKFIYLSNH